MSIYSKNTDTEAMIVFRQNSIMVANHLNVATSRDLVISCERQRQQQQ